MKSHSLNILLCCCLLSGCATEFAYNRKCRSFINRPVMDLLYEFGSPVRTYNTGDVEVLEFYSERQVYEQSMLPQRTAIQNSYRQTIGYLQSRDEGSYVQRRCTTTFFTRYGFVYDYRFAGNDCTAYFW